jgi:phage terminase small subunit
MTAEEILAILRRDNPGGRPDELAMYASFFLDFREAQENITKNGNIVAHPRTGAPMENPYIKIKVGAMNQLAKLPRVRNVGALWGE